MWFDSEAEWDEEDEGDLWAMDADTAKDYTDCSEGGDFLDCNTTENKLIHEIFQVCTTDAFGSEAPSLNKFGPNALLPPLLPFDQAPF